MERPSTGGRQCGHEAHQGMSSCALLCVFLISGLTPHFLPGRRSSAAGRTQEHSRGRPKDHGRGRGYYRPWQCGLGPRMRPRSEKCTSSHACFNSIYPLISTPISTLAGRRIRSQDHGHGSQGYGRWSTPLTTAADISGRGNSPPVAIEANQGTYILVRTAVYILLSDLTPNLFCQTQEHDRD